MKIDNAFVLEHQAHVRRQIERNYPSIQPSIVDDLVAEVFIKAINNEGKYDSKRGTVETWLSVFVGNIISDHFSNRGHSMDAMNFTDNLSLDEDWSDGEEEESLTGHEILDAEDYGYDTKYFLKECIEVEHYLQMLPARLAVVVQLRLIRGHSWEEVAQTMNCSKENVRVMCKKAEQELKRLIEGA